MSNVYRLALGTLTVAALQADPTFIVANFTRARGENWSVETMNLVNPGVRRTRRWGAGIVEFGNTVISPWLLLITGSQSDYLETTFFQGAPSAVVTIQTMNFYKNKDWEVYNCYMVRPQLIQGSVTQSNDIRWNKFQLSFLPGTLAAAS